MSRPLQHLTPEIHASLLVGEILRNARKIIVSEMPRDLDATEARARFWWTNLDEMLSDWEYMDGDQRDVMIEHIQQMVLDGAIYPERCDECYEVKTECICARICKWCGTTDCDEPECAERIAEGAVL